MRWASWVVHMLHNIQRLTRVAYMCQSLPLYILVPLLITYLIWAHHPKMFDNFFMLVIFVLADPYWCRLLAAVRYNCGINGGVVRHSDFVNLR